MPGNVRVRVTFFLLERGTQGADYFRYFAYGHAIPIDCESYLGPLDEISEQQVDLTLKDSKVRWAPLSLVIQTFFISSEVFEAFKAGLDQGRFLPQIIGSSASQTGFAVVARPPVIQFDADTARNSAAMPPPESGLGGPARVLSYWALSGEQDLIEALDPVPSPLDDDLCSPPGHDENDEASIATSPLEVMANRERSRRLAHFIGELKSRTGLSFDGPYAQRLGTMECFDSTSSEASGAPPVIVRVHQRDPESRENVPMGIQILKKQPAFSADWAHVVLRNNGDVILDQLVALPKEFQESEVIAAEEPISEYEVRLFDEGGKSLVWMERLFLIRNLGFSMNMVTGRKTYRDDLSEKLVNNKVPAGKRLEQADSFSPRNFQVGGHEHDPWVPRARSMARMVEARISTPKTTHWFPRGIAGQGDALDHLRNFIDSPRTVEAVLVDPFFGEHAFSRILPRLRNMSLQITVLTSCLGWDPDKEWARGPNPEWEKSAQAQRNRIKGWCRTNQAVLPPNLTILDLRKDKDQAFHDRYLLRVNDQGGISIHMLSTSLNDLAGQYPCCFVELDSSAAREVYSYIRGLTIHRDVTNWVADPCGALLDREVIWSPDKARKSKSEVSPSESPEDNGDQNSTEEFPFEMTLLRWLLNEPTLDLKALRDCAQEQGLRKESARWIREEENLGCMLGRAWNRFPQEIPDQAQVLAGLGEFLAHSRGSYDPLADAAQLFREHPLDLDLSAILAWVACWYTSQPQPHGIRNLPADSEALSTEHYLLEEESRTFELLNVAEVFCKQGVWGHRHGLFGMRYLIQWGIGLAPVAPDVVKWFDWEHEGQPHICAAIVSALVSMAIENRIDIVPTLLSSKRPLVQSFGVVILFSEELPNRTSDNLLESSEAVRILLENGVSGQEVVWMAALPVPGAQAAAFRNRKFPEVDPRRKQAEDRLSRLLDRIANRLILANPTSHHLDQLDAALRRTTRDRCRIAQLCDEIRHDIDCPPWEELYRRCVSDAEELMGLQTKRGRKQKEFHFYEHNDFDVLEAGTSSLLRIHGARWATPFRNRVADHVEQMVRCASDPHLRYRNHSAWNNAVGRSAAGCLLGLTVCLRAEEQGLRLHLVPNAERIVRLTCQVFLAAGEAWFDIAGLLDRLAENAAWVAQNSSEDFDLTTVLQAVDDTRLPNYIRACLSTVPRRVFESKPDRAFEQVNALVENRDPRAATRFFYLLDILIGNSHLSGVELGHEVEAMVAHGLKVFPDIAETWKAFFKSSWSALKGDSDKEGLILRSPTANQSYCGLILKGGVGES